MTRLCLSILFPLVLSLTLGRLIADDSLTMDLWPNDVPGPASHVEGEERDLTKPDDNLIAGRPIIKLGHVRTPQMQVFFPDSENNNGGAVLICPGGGFSILAWDLEGTEVAQWLNSIGFTAVVVKYRVPTREHGAALNDNNTLPLNSTGPVMDAQRALSLTRAKSQEWKIDPQRIGILGFSAGGETAGLTALALDQREYAPLDSADNVSCAPSFAILIYPAGFVDRQTNQLKAHIRVSDKSPPTFFTMTEDDDVNCENCTALFTALKREGVPAELHLFTRGGHGYGLRRTEFPVTQWPTLAAAWLDELGFSKGKNEAK